MTSPRDDKQFNFQPEFSNSDYFQDYIKQHQEEVQKQIGPNRSRIEPLAWLLVIILSVSTVSLSYWIYEDSRNSSRNSAATLTFTKPTENVLSGDNFSLLLDEKTPIAFETRDQISDAKLFPTSSRTTTILATKKINDKEAKSGIEVTSWEYDFRQDLESFTKSIASSLGSNYNISGERTRIPKDLELIQIKNSKDANETYYIGLTRNYYYVIRLRDELKNDPESNNLTRFTSSLVPNIYLN